MHAFDRRTDGQTDRQTDTFLVAIPRWHSMQLGKKLIETVILASSYYDIGPK